MSERRFRTVLSREAIAQIVDQADYYKEKSGTVLAEKWRVAVRDAARSLQAMPERHRVCQFKSASISNVRRIAIKGFPSHSLFYRVENDIVTVHILYMLHGARDIEEFFESQI